MWWVGSERLTVYLGAASVAARRGAADAIEWQQVDTAPSGFEQVLRALVPAQRTRRRSLDVQLSGGLARPFVLDAVRGLRNLREATELATSVAPEATGLQGPCTVWLEDWSPDRQCIAVAMDRSLRDQLEAIAASGGWRIDAMRPWWSIAIDAAKSKFQDPSRLLAIEDTDSLTMLDCAHAAGHVTASTHTPRLDPVPLRATLARAALAADLRTSDILFVAMQARHGLEPVVERWT